MPPFVTTECPKCKHSNRFDLAELRSKDTVAYKFFDVRSLTSKEEEFSVTCQQCGCRFKLTVKEGQNGTEE